MSILFFQGPQHGLRTSGLDLAVLGDRLGLGRERLVK